MDEDVRGDRSSKLPFNTQELRATLFSLTNRMPVHIQVTDAPDSQTPLTHGHPCTRTLQEMDVTHSQVQRHLLCVDVGHRQWS
jgi:hypothetical protein